MDSRRFPLGRARAKQLRFVTGIGAVFTMLAAAVSVDHASDAPQDTTFSHSSINTIGISTPYTTPTTPSMNMGATMAPETALPIPVVASATPSL
ncbi:hypothetical protein [Mycolicibacterium canariasense]|nr:hypothetical protein [Mycolicibacterium canariasense]MCV7211993.1 hypothetical protein [Mycolicibacterium canariasense]